MNQMEIFRVMDELLREATNIKLKVMLDELKTVCKREYRTRPDVLLAILDALKLQNYEARTALKLTAIRKPRVKKELPPESRCMARIGLGNQCSRSRIINSEYCKSHTTSLPYGTIGEEPPEKQPGRKRGRRKKATIEYTRDDLDMNKYVQAMVIQIPTGQGDEVKDFLVDQHNVLYQYDSNNVIVGRLIEIENGELSVEWY